MSDAVSYRILLLGDFAYGENYPSGGADILRSEGYGHSTVNVRPFIEHCDQSIVNLETPLARREEFPSSVATQKSWVQWADPSGSGSALAELGIDAVTLGNDHTMDLGRPGLEATLTSLDALGIRYFGAGTNRADAEKPLRLVIPEKVGGGEIAIYGAYQYSRRVNETNHTYAEYDSAGSARVAQGQWVRPSAHELRADTLHVAFPHWGPSYGWMSPRQETLAQALTSGGYDLVIGHGTHSIQEVSAVNGRWVVYGIGNGVFQSSGGWTRHQERTGILPFGFWTVLEVSKKHNGGRRVELKLYPVYSDNNQTHYRPGPVSEKDFGSIVRTLTARESFVSHTPKAFRQIGKDELGHHIRLDIADWSEGRRPTLLTEKQQASWHALVEGPRVQRVGYRRWLEELAYRHELTGWVRNRGAGTVEAMLNGEEKEVWEVISRLPEGPSTAKASSIKISKSINEYYDGFSILADVPESYPGRKNNGQAACGEKMKSVCQLSLNETAGVTLREIGELLGGRWVGECDLDQRIHKASFRLNTMGDGKILFVMDPHSWKSKSRRRLGGQLGLSVGETLDRAASAGASAAVVVRPVQNPPLPILVVNNAREASFTLARKAREAYGNPVVGITGTVGKSSTTSLLTHVLSKRSVVHRTDANWNTVDGVADTLSGLLSNPDVAVVEAAISGFVRVPQHSAEKMIRPDVAIITAIGVAHRDLAPTAEDTARIKGKLVTGLRPGGSAILTADTPHLGYLEGLAEDSGARQVLTFGRAALSNYQLKDWAVTESGMRVSALLSGHEVEYDMSSAGEGLALNSLGVIAAAKALGLDLADVLEALGDYVANDHVAEISLIPVEGGTALMIDDSTNATVMSMKSAFELLGRVSQQYDGRALAALGQINYLGDRAESLHASLAEPLIAAGAEIVMTTGAGMNQLRTDLGARRCGAHAESPEGLVQEIRRVLKPGDVLLVKGSNVGTGFRRVAELLLG